MFNFDSFAKDLSSYKTEEYHSLAYINEDSAELVIGLDTAQSDYTDVYELIFESGGKLVNTVSMRGGLVAVVAEVPFNLVSSFEAQLQSSSLVRYVEPNMKFETQFVPDDTYWNLQWGPKKIEADYAWDTTIGEPSVLVAVIDTGVDYDHPDLDANYVALGYDWVNNDNDPMDDHGHGTHCAGIVAAELSNAVGIAGVAQVSIMAEKGLDSGGVGYEDDLANALIHAVDQGADILSNSWGGYGQSALIYDAVKYAYDAGVLIVAAAGNSATSNKLYPAAYDEVIAVTATDKWDDPASFTNFGDWVEVAAPGVDIYSTFIGDSYTYMSGTSMSTPHVSGTAALIWSQFPGMSRDWVRAQLKFTAEDLGDPGFDDYYGYGRINARKAVELAPADHDLLIDDWQRPKFVQPGDLVTYNVTVFNFGQNDESDITVQLLVDNSITDSATIDFLATGAADTVSVMWNAAVEGTYNATVWVEPVLGETNIENNAMSAKVNVQPVSTALLMNADPWGYPANENALSKYGVPYAVFSSADFGIVDLTKFSKVIVASDQDQKFYDDMAAYRVWFEDYVSGGGLLEIHAADYGWNGGMWNDSLPGGLVYSRYAAQYVTIVDPSHPVVNVPNPITDTELDNWSAAVHGFFTSYPPNSRIVIKEDGTGYPAYLEFDYGTGAILATSQTLEWGYTRGYSLILENSLLYIRAKYPHELSVTLDAPDFLEPSDSPILNATVYNIGLNNETIVEIQLLIDGSVVESAVAPELLSGLGFTISYDWIQPAEGDYNITAYAPPVPDEEFSYNNKVTQLLAVAYPLISPTEGQWASYILNYYDDMDQITNTEYWNLIYDHYIEPYKIYITLVVTDANGYNNTGWMVVNTMTRFVESGAWVGMWYPGWIETDIDLGSQVNLLNGVVIVNGSRIVPVGICPIDCWELPLWYGIQYTFWYDKVSGLWIGMDLIVSPQRLELRLIDTNISIGTPYEHELAATVEAPARLEPNDSSLLNATAYNVGLNTETSVKLSLLIDGTEVASEVIPAFLNGTSHTISYTWMPTVEATYNVTAYVQPVAGEAFAVNNAATELVRVRSIKGYVLFDQTHWTDSIFRYSIWVHNITDRGYVVDTLTTSPLTSAALQGYDVFVIPQAYNYYYSDELSAIQDFVLEGGGLLVIGDDNPYVYSDLTSFAGITWESGGYGGSTHDITQHQVTEGVETAYFAAPMSRLSVTVPAQDLIRDSGGYIMLAVSETGAGAVIGISDEDSITDYYVGTADNLRLANNMIDWLSSRSPVVSFTYSPLDPYVGETVSFNGSASYDPDGDIVDYLWSFGDNETATGVAATHAYVAGGVYKVTLTAIDNDGLDSTATANVTVARTTLEVSVEVGSIHFRGELAEFYILVSSLGAPVDVDLTATLYYGGAVYADLSANVEHVSTGVYRIPYAVPVAASPGTYALTVDARYLSLKGVALKSFLLSSTLTGWNTLLVDINGTVATLKTDTGLIKVQLDTINAKLVSIEGKVATISSTLGSIQTDTSTLNAKLISIDGKMVTIDSALGEIQTDINTVNAMLVGLKDTVATIQTDVGKITTDIADIKLKITSINGTTATIETSLGTIEGQITSIHDDELATIVTDLGTVVASLPKGWAESQQQSNTPLYTLMVLILIISIGTITLTYFRRKKS